MKEYSIKQIESITGIKAHTIRAWEQRYNFFKSKRNSSNIRSFSFQDLQQIMKICFLNNQGYKLCILDGMPQEQINQLIDRQVFEEDKDDLLQKMLLSTINIDLGSLEQMINSQIQTLGFDKFLEELLWPFMGKLSLLRHTQVVTQRHFQLISEVLQRKLYRKIDEALDSTQENLDEVMLMDISRGDDKLALLGLHYLLLNENLKVWNTGSELPLHEISCLSHMIQPKYIFIYSGIHKKIEPNSTKVIFAVREFFPEASVFLAGCCEDLPDELAHNGIKTMECLKNFPKLQLQKQIMSV